ncbi:peptidase M48, Ste24p [Magnetococcus marinus MC-1]|uniref:Peptidase M48, Ste24p n=1 Tax=Magnetococcus marinus (strain ATCC BAA-1437 / JCM 17883 / MC-1) TaxID=156889 RepID=A0LBW5_MAGMM|nr:M48 family metalloprotease [Magnetococcus marinus]ABK45458.1 peptidase M48, Ste24p [Magnetococcus marinus MC-1]
MFHPPSRPPSSRRYSRRETLWLLSLTTAGWASSSLLSGCSVNPVTGEQQLMLMSPAQELAVDRQHAPQQFSNDFGAVQDEALNRYLTRVGQEMAQLSHRPQVPYNYRAVNATHVNAYTFPAGSTAVTRGILLEMQNEAELAALLGHELGHVNARHAAQRQTRSLFTQLGLSGIGYLSSYYSQTAGMLVNSLGGVTSKALLSSYSRDDERQADALGMAYMAKGGHNPAGMVGLMELLSAQSKQKPNALETMFATHPMSRERLSTAKRRFQESYRNHQAAPNNRARYMDHTATIRAQKPTIEWIQKADTALANKQVSQAESCLAKALKSTEDDYTALVKMAKIQLAKGDARGAKRYVELAKHSYPNEAQALHVAAITNLTSGNPSAAHEDLLAYERVVPGNPQTTFLQGKALDDMQRPSEAARYYRAYLRRGSRDAYSHYAQQRLQQWSQTNPQP